MLSGVAVLALACASASTAIGQTMKPACAANNPAVWWVPAANTYYRKGQAGYGKGAGQLVCRSAAVEKKAHARAKPMTGTMRAAPHPMMASPMPMRTGPGANPTATPAAEPAGPNPPPMPGMSPPMPHVSPLPGGPSPAPAAT